MESPLQPRRRRGKPAQILFLHGYGNSALIAGCPDCGGFPHATAQKAERPVTAKTMRNDWRHLLSWTELLCFVLVWSIGIGVTVLQFYARTHRANAADVAATAPVGPAASLID